MMVAKISTEHKHELDRMEDEFTKEIQERDVAEKSLRDELEKMTVKYNNLSKKLTE